MQALLVQQKCVKALEGDSAFPKGTKPEDIQEVYDSAFSLLILNLSNNALRQVDEGNIDSKI